MGLTKEQLKVKAEKLQRERDEELARERAEWTAGGMMALLERASSNGMEIRVAGGKFLVFGYDEYNDQGKFIISTNPIDFNDWNPIYDLTNFVDRIERHLEEQRILRELRNSALGKLTKEEIEALGLKKSIF